MRSAAVPGAEEPEAPWLPWLRRLQGGFGASAATVRSALALHIVWLVLLGLAFAAPAWVMLHEAGVFWQHARGSVADPVQLDYGESPLLAQAVQWLHGQQIYHNDAAPPFTVGNYTPIFTWATAAVAALWTGVRMGAGRAVSAAGCFLTALAIAGCTWESASLPLLWPRRGSRPRGALHVPWGLRLALACFSGGVYLSARYVWSWGILGRVDALAVGFSMAGVWWTLRAGYRPADRGRDRLWLAGLLFMCAVYTRQDVVEGAVASIAGLALYDWRRALRLAAWTAGLCAAMGALLLATSHGQFYIQVFLYNENHFSWGTVRSAWLQWLQGSGGGVLLRIAIAGALIWLLSGGQVSAGLLLGLTLLTSATVGKIGSSINYFLPLLAACAWCTGLLGLRAAGLAAGGPWVLKWLGLAVPALFLTWATAVLPWWAVPFGHLSPAYGRFLERSASSTQTLRHTARSWGGTAGGRVSPQWSQLIALVAAAPGPVVSEDMSFVVLAGRPLAFQPFELTQASEDGHWDQNLFVQRLLNGDYALVILPVNVLSPHAGLDLSRWSPAMYAAVRQAYTVDTVLAGQFVYTPTVQ